MNPDLLFVTPYPPGDSRLGGAGWVDSRLYRSLVDSGAAVRVLTVTGPPGDWMEEEIPSVAAGNLPLEVRGDRIALARIVLAMLASRNPYQACKFTAFPGWEDAKELIRRESSGRSVFTSGWPALLLASEAGVLVDLHLAHNVETLVAARHAPLPLRILREESRLRRLEKRLLSLPRSVRVLSETDRQRLACWQITSDRIPLPLVPARSWASDKRRVGFIGKAGWPPNADAIETLLGPVHDSLSALGCDIEYVLAGKGTERFVDHPRVVKAGPVDDLSEFYDRIGLIVVPRLGTSTGISVKVLEAAEYGVPAVLPAALAAAIDPAGPWIVADQPQAMAEAIAAWADGTLTPPDISGWVGQHQPAVAAADVLDALGTVGDDVMDPVSRSDRESSAPEPSAVVIAGVPVDDVTMETAVDMVWRLVTHGRRTGATHQVATVNADFVVNSMRSPALLELMQRTSLAVPDGMPLVWGSRLLGGRLKARVAGADLVPALVERAGQTGGSIALYGAAPGVAARASAILQDRYPNASVFGASLPMNASIESLDDEALIELKEFDADICCIALGNPKQEYFIDRFGSSLGVPVMIGVGATLDFIVGDKRRAPKWMQSAGLEWLHRALSEPRRLVRRYARDIVLFVPSLATQAWRGRSANARGHVIIRWQTSSSLVIDVSGLTEVDNGTVNRLAAATRRARRQGADVEIIGDVGRLLATTTSWSAIVCPAAEP